MQSELEKWIQEHALHSAHHNGKATFRFYSHELIALLDGKVLCDAEPVAWLCKSADGLVDATASEFVRDDYARFKREITPLYKAAGAGEG